jgi:DNA topoisomerase-1
MAVAQQLYEQGHITYHRTDSFNLAADAVNAARTYIAKEFGPTYLPGKPNIYVTKSKNAQEAHEAIRPTTIDNGLQITGAGNGLDARQHKLYRLIWQRLLACQMTPAVYDQTAVTVLATSHKPQATSYRLRANGKVMKFEGWRRVYAETSKSKSQSPTNTSDENVLLPEVTEQEPLTYLDLTSEQKFTQPPARFNDASLIKELEKRGIGRPSTYAPTISTIIARGYVERVERRFSPTAVGDTVTAFLEKNFTEIMDYDFTAEMEEDLDRISRGEKDWKKVLKTFYTPFKKQVLAVEKNAERSKVPVETTDERCPDCKQGMLVIRSGRFGKFLSCERFPECKYTASFTKKLENFACPNCGGDVVMKRTRKGRNFWGCSNYPKCEYASWKDPSASSGHSPSASFGSAQDKSSGQGPRTEKAEAAK